MKSILTFPILLSLMACDVVDIPEQNVRDFGISVQPVETAKRSLGSCVVDEEGLVSTLASIEGDEPIQRILNTDGSSMVVQRMGQEVDWLSTESMTVHDQFVPDEYAHATHVMNQRLSSVVEYVVGDQHSLIVYGNAGRGVKARIDTDTPIWDARELVSSPNGKWVIATQWYGHRNQLNLANVRRGTFVQSNTVLDGATEALFLDNDTLVVGGSINWGGIGIELKQLNNAETSIASWVYEDRRCGSPGQIHSIELSPSGETLLVGGELYGDGFIALLDSQTLEEKSIIYDLDWSAQRALFIDEDTIAIAAGSSIRFWDVNTQRELRDIQVDVGIVDMAVTNDSLWLVDYSGALIQVECRE